uniref:Ig-like domain-containing protein n=1 Tax=Neogobius melanostomus TaxID=47308 RepID=A0A8C6USX1_9GOBI
MLWSLFFLTTALTCANAVTVVTQSPAALTMMRGETASMDCNLGTVTDQSARWYKQIPGEIPKYVLKFHHSFSKVEYGSGFSAPKFTSTNQDETSYRLIINNVDEGDSAIYHCTTWDDIAKEHVSQNSTSVLCSPCSCPDCVPPSYTELQSGRATLLCVSRQSVPFAEVTWLADGTPVSSEVWSSSTVQQPEQTFHMSSSLSIHLCHWSSHKVYTCRVSVGPHSTEAHISQSHVFPTNV